MNKQCKECGAEIDQRAFCSNDNKCRNRYVSRVMQAKAKEIKKTVGNTYYGKKAIQE